MTRQDHTFLFAGPKGSYGLAFCPARDTSEAEARASVKAVVREAVPGSTLAYLGLLDYTGMDEWAGQMLDPFEKHGRIWLARFAGSAK